jgi:hypothetical protein
MIIYSDTHQSVDFKPTYLYIKQHNITGLKYFGKTTQKDPLKYNGSGTYWKRHLNQHGVDISTVWHKLFTVKDELVTYALSFSKENNIVESTQWANLKPEDGLRGGGAKGIKIKPHSAEHRKNISNAINEFNHKHGKTRKPKQKAEKKCYGWKWREENRLKHSLWQLGIPKPRMCCIHCRKEGAIANIQQWHGDKCKNKPI